MSDEHDQWLRKIGVCFINPSDDDGAIASAPAAAPSGAPTVDVVSGADPAAAPAGRATGQGWTFDPTDPKKKPPVNLRLPDDYPVDVTPRPSTDDDSSKPAKKDGSGVDTDAVVGVSKDGVEVQARMTFHSDLTGNLGETQFTVHVGPNGKLSQFEVDVTVIHQKIEKMGVLARMIELEASLSLNSTVDIDSKTNKVIFGQVQVQAKAELEAHFKSSRIPGLEKVSFKLTATAGSGGFSATVGIEIPIPGT